jgi:sigma-B regulation protein RsbU (phosphoserine phosphatase)
MNLNRLLPKRLKERFTIIAVFCSCIIFLFTAPVTIWQGRELMLHGRLDDLDNRLDIQVNKLKWDLRSIKQQVHTITDLLQQWSPSGMDSWYIAMEKTLNSLPYAHAVIVAFEPDNHLGPKGVRTLLLYRKGAKEGSFNRGQLSYDPNDPASLGTQWYIPPRKGNIEFIDGFWSLPYRSSYEGNVPEITCSVPINREESGSLVVDGVLAIDITLESMLKTMSGLDIKTEFQLFILDPQCRLLTGIQGNSAYKKSDGRLQEFIHANPRAMVSFLELRNPSVPSASFIAINPNNGEESIFLSRKISGIPLIFLYVFPVHDLISDAWWLAGGVFLFGVICIGGMGLLFRWSAGLATRNLDVLRKGVGNVRSGNLTAISTSSLTHDETADVIDAFNGMVSELQLSLLRKEEMARSQQRLKTELELARNIQNSVLPESMKLMGGSHFSLSIPALEVGGDFFDHFVLPGGCTVFTIGDVSGKGVSAAMFMMRVSLLFRSIAAVMEPHQAVTRLNSLLAESNPQMMFVTFFLAVLDPLGQRLICVNGGHNPPVLVRADGTVEWLVEKSGPAIGVLPGKHFTAWHVPFSQGDLLAIYTDGISEAMDPSGEQFGLDRLSSFLQQSQKRSLQQSAEELVSQVMSWQGEEDQFDDITLTLIRAGEYAHELRLPASYSTIENVVELIEQSALEGGMESKAVSEISLAVCEAVTNVISYSLHEDPTLFYRVFTSWSGDDFVVRIEDSGPLFDPAALAPVNTNLPLEERPIGGMGWFLIRQYTDEIRMFRSSDTNILTLVRSRNSTNLRQKNNSMRDS